MTGPLCAGEDVDIWFEGTPAYDPELARAICLACPVRQECLARAVRLHINDGIYGGFTPEQRRRMRRGGAA